MYLKQPRGAVRSYGGMGDAISDTLCSTFNIGCPAPVDPNAVVIDIATTEPSPDATGPTVQVSTIGGQTSAIPSSDPGGGYTTNGGFVSVGGVCKPTDSTSLDAFKELQRQANRIADGIGATKIGVDGAIGSATVALLAAIKASASAAGAQYSGQGWPNFIANQNVGNCSAIAGGAANLIPMLSAMADAMGISSSVSSPAAATAPTIYNPITGKEKPQGLASDASDLLNNLSMPMKLAALGVAGGIGYVLWRDMSKSKRKGRR